nr:hypothetical protein [Mycobacterium interjectum]
MNKSKAVARPETSRPDPKTAPAVNAPAAPRNNVWREISRANVGLPRLRHARILGDQTRGAA